MTENLPYHERSTTDLVKNLEALIQLKDLTRNKKAKAFVEARIEAIKDILKERNKKEKI